MWSQVDYGLPADVEIPKFSLYMSPPGTCKLLREVFAQIQPDLVIEFGAGVSTLVLRDLASSRPDCTVYSIENDAVTAFHPMYRGVNMILAPITYTWRWYDRMVLRRRLPLSRAEKKLLAFVDGPSTALSGPRGRGLALALIDELFPRWIGAVLLDDVQRRGEAADFADWAAAHPEAQTAVVSVEAKSADPRYVHLKRIGILTRGIEG
jgi:hypothetical protein